MARLTDQDRIARLTRQLEASEHERKTIASAFAKLDKEFRVLEQLSNVNTGAKGVPKRGKTVGNRAIPHLLLSDLHLDEVVRPAEIEGVNAYNRKIATQRLSRTFTGTVKILREHWTSIAYDGIHV